MNGRGPSYDIDPEHEDVPIRDRTYESFGQQGLAMPTYSVEEGDARGEVDFPVGEALEPNDHGDERLHDDVCEKLSQDGVDTSDLEVVVHEREVVLCGTVADGDQRGRAGDVAAHVRGVVEVVNRIHVRR